MNNYIFAGISFLAGAAAGCVATWIVAKKRYEKRHKAAMVAVWADLQKIKKSDDINERAETMGTTIHTPDEEKIVSKPDLMTWANTIKNNAYDYPEDLKQTDDMIFEISENDLDEEEYDISHLIYYADGIITDEDDMPLKKVETYLGPDVHSLMAGKDELIIRNKKLKIDYDICRSELTYGENLENHPETEQRFMFQEAMDEYAENEDEEDEDE